MNKTKREIISIYSFLNELNDYKLPIKVAYSLFSLSKEIKDKYTFFIQEEKKIFEHYHAEFVDGSVHLKDPEKMKDFIKEINDQSVFNVEIQINEPIVLRISDLPDNLITIQTIHDLEGVISFQ